ncbi:MAG: hypothetical protein IAG13_09525, partial [Deltaproteobacteria bacterium]|nr:hypothetical protein [Nannocystaceae bacterium]
MGAVLPTEDADEAAPAWMSGLSGVVQRRLLRFGIRTPAELLAFPWDGPEWTGFFGEDGMREIEALAARLRASTEPADRRETGDGELDREIEAAVCACVSDDVAAPVLAWIGLHAAAPPTFEKVAARFGSTRELVREQVERCRTLAQAPGLAARFGSTRELVREQVERCRTLAQA